MPPPQFRPGPQMPTPHHVGGPQMPTPHHVGGPQMPQPQHVRDLPPGFQPYPPVIPAVIPQERRTPTPPFPPVIPQMPQQQPGFIMVNQPGVPVIPMDGFRPPSRMHSVPPRQHMEEQPIPFIPSMARSRSRSTGSPRPYPMTMPMHPMGPSIIHVPQEEESSSAPSSPSGSRAGSRRDYRDSRRRRPSRSESRRAPSSRHRPRSRSSSRSSGTHSSPQQLFVTPVPGTAPGMIPAVMQDPRLQHLPPVHVFPPSVPGSVLGPGGPRHPELQGQLPQQQPPIIIQHPGQQPMMVQTPMPMPMGQPMMTAPSGLPYAGTAPVIIQEGSPPSSRSSSRTRSSRSRRRRRTTPPIMAPPPAAPIILADTRRSSSPRHPLEPYMQMPPPTTILPPQPFGTGPPGAVVMVPSRSRSSSSRSRHRRRSRSRSDSYERPPVIIGGAPPGPVYPQYPQPTGTAPTQVLVPGGMVGQPPAVVVAGSHSSSRSRSPRQQAVPIIVPPIQQQPTYRDHSRSRSPRRRESSPRREAYPAYPAQVPVVIPSRYSSRHGYDSPSPRRGERYRRDRGRYYSDYSPSPTRHRRGSRRGYSPSRDDDYRGRRRSPPRHGRFRDYTRSPTREDDPRAPRDRLRRRYPEDRSPTREDDPRAPRDRLRRRYPEDRSPEHLGRPPTGIHGTFRTSRPPSTEYQEHRPDRAPFVPSRRPGSQSPTRVPAPTTRGPEHVQADDHDDRAPPIRVTVPTSQQRPPTVMTLEPEELHGVSRVPTRHRPSGGRRISLTISYSSNISFCSRLPHAPFNLPP